MDKVFDLTTINGLYDVATFVSGVAKESDKNLQRLQQAINGIEAAQNDLSPDELSAFKVLVELYTRSNFESSESERNIQIIKNALQQHNKNRLLKMYLTNFVTLCEKYFKIGSMTFVASVPVISLPQITPPAFEPPTVIQPPLELTLPQQAQTPLTKKQKYSTSKTIRFLKYIVVSVSFIFITFLVFSVIDNLFSDDKLYGPPDVVNYYYTPMPLLIIVLCTVIVLTVIMLSVILIVKTVNKRKQKTTSESILTKKESKFSLLKKDNSTPAQIEALKGLICVANENGVKKFVVKMSNATATEIGFSFDKYSLRLLSSTNEYESTYEVHFSD